MFKMPDIGNTGRSRFKAGNNNFGKSSNFRFFRRIFLVKKEMDQIPNSIQVKSNKIFKTGLINAACVYNICKRDTILFTTTVRYSFSGIIFSLSIFFVYYKPFG